MTSSFAPVRLCDPRNDVVSVRIRWGKNCGIQTNQRTNGQGVSRSRISSVREIQLNPIQSNPFKHFVLYLIEGSTSWARADPNKYFPALGLRRQQQQQLVSRCEHLFYGTHPQPPPPPCRMVRVEYGAIYKGQPRLGDAGSGASMAGPSWLILVTLRWSLPHPPTPSTLHSILIYLAVTVSIGQKANNSVKLCFLVFK